MGLSEIFINGMYYLKSSIFAAIKKKIKQNCCYDAYFIFFFFFMTVLAFSTQEARCVVVQ